MTGPRASVAPRARLVRVLALSAFLALGVQLVPYGRDHVNPPVIAEPPWDSDITRSLVAVVCFDCHSNQTAWPWYSNIAPLSWRIQQNVDEGRRTLNFSEWGRGEQETDEIVETVQEGEMPPADYLWLHPEARLSAPEGEQLLSGLIRTFGAGHEGD